MLEWLMGVTSDLTDAQATTIVGIFTLAAAVLAGVGVALGVWFRDRAAERERWWQRVRWLADMYREPAGGPVLAAQLITACSSALPVVRPWKFWLRWGHVHSVERKMLDAILLAELSGISSEDIASLMQPETEEPE